MKNKYLMVMYCIFILNITFCISSSGAYCAVIELVSTSYTNSAGLTIIDGTTYSDMPDTTTYADAGFNNSSEYWAQIKRGSDILINNNYIEDAAGIHSQLTVSLDGFSKGKINVVPGFVTGSASSLAEYSLVARGGSGSFDAVLFITPAGNTYETSPSHKIDLFDSIGKSIFQWQDDDPMGPEAISLKYNELYCIKAFSETNLWGGAGSEFDYESSLILSLDAVQTTAVPVPSAIFLFVPGLMCLLGLKQWTALKI